MKTPKKSKGRPFKKFYCDRIETFLLPPVAFKIWMYHFSREGTDRKSWPAVKTAMAACGITRDITFYRWRAYLRKNGWLEKIGEVPSRNAGGRPVPIFKVTRGTIPSKVNTAKSDVNPTAKSDVLVGQLGTKNAPNPTAKNASNPTAKNASRSRVTEVEPLEVDSNTLNPEVEGGSGSLVETGQQDRASARNHAAKAIGLPAGCRVERRDW